MLNYNEIKPRTIIIYQGEPCEVIENHVARKQQNKPQNQTKLKSLLTGKTFAATFHSSETAEEAEIEKRDIKFIYENRGEYWFCSPDDPSNRFQIDAEVLGDSTKFLKGNQVVVASVWDNQDEEQIIKITLPIKMEFKVKEAPPSIKGNTAQGGKKDVVLETGAVVTTPMFIETGEQIVVNTETGEYVERVK